MRTLQVGDYVLSTNPMEPDPWRIIDIQDDKAHCQLAQMPSQEKWFALSDIRLHPSKPSIVG